MADELTQDVTAPPAAEPDPAPPPAEAAPPPEPPAADPAAAPAPAEPQWQGVRDYARSQGVELPYDDDGAALNALLAAQRQASERNYYADLGRRVVPHADQWAAFLKQRQAQEAAPAPPPAYQPPEWDDRWLNMVEKDPNTGDLRAKAGYDPAVADKVTKFAEWREGFLKNPASVIAPLIQEEARKLVDVRFAEQNERHTAESLVARNAAWMFAADAQGAPAYGAQGRRQLTPAGALYAQAVDTLWRGGMRDARQIDALARGQVENAVMRQQLLQQRPAAAGAPQLGAAGAPPSVGGALTRPAAGLPAAGAPQKGRSLREMMLVNLERAELPEHYNL